MGLMDNVKKGVQRAKEGAQELAQTTKLRAEISRLKSQRRELYSEMGEEIYAMYKRGEPIAGFNTRCDAVDEINREISVKEQEIEALKEE
jgi:predicted RNase H-like nuclease (RuvC/YqgF family)